MTSRPRPYTLTDWQARAIAEDRLGLIVKPITKKAAHDAIAVFGPGFLLKPGNIDLLPFAPDDLLWCREAWGFPGLDNYRVVYGADWAGVPWLGWRSPVTMPKWASRTTLRVLSVDVRRVQDITAIEAMKTGVEFDHGLPEESGALPPCDEIRAWQAFEAAFGFNIFDANPWCAFGRVKVEKTNVEACGMERKA